MKCKKHVISIFHLDVLTRSKISGRQRTLHPMFKTGFEIILSLILLTFNSFVTCKNGKIAPKGIRLE